MVEPDPNGNGSITAAGNMVTSYQYDALDQLTVVTQGEQTRAFKYDSLGRLTRQKLAEQAATIEGLWSDTFVYDNRSNLVQRTDARGVKTNFVYNNDPLNRLQSINYDKTNAINNATIADAGAVTISYVTGGDKSRVETVTTAATAITPAVTEYNHYDSMSRVDIYNLTISGRSSMISEYEYDTASRLTKVKYPLQHGTPNPTDRKIVEPTYDNASRLKDLKVNTATQLSNIVYNPMSQVTSLRTGADTANPDIEEYSYDNQTGLLTNQIVKKASNNQELLNLSYEYLRGNSNGSINGKTGQLTKITNNRDQNKNRIYEFDTLGRLRKANGGAQAGGVQTSGTPAVTATWNQIYGYDRFGNRETVTATGVTANNQNVPTDGLASLSYNAGSNQINTSGYQYDVAGNQIRGQKPDGTFQRFDYDAAGRLVKVMDDSSNELESFTYGASRQRLITQNSSNRTYYAWGGSSVLCEYTEALNSSALVFAQSYIYAGSRLLSTQIWNGSSETTEFHYPDRLGTKLVTNNSSNQHYEQSTLPFGTSLDAEFVGTPTTNQKFTSYDRSQIASLDYAVNRSYSSGQGRFTTVDPIGMSSSEIGNPQSNNLYAYVENNPIDFVDPSGLDGCVFWVNPDGTVQMACIVDALNGNNNSIGGGGGRLGGIDQFLTEQNEDGNNGGETGGGSGGSGLSKIGKTSKSCSFLSDLMAENKHHTKWWQGKNGKWYFGTTGRGPNQYTGSRAVGFSMNHKTAGTFVKIARFTAGLSILITANDIRNGYIHPVKGGVDIGMAAVGVLGGPPGAAASATYFGVNLIVSVPDPGGECHKKTRNIMINKLGPPR